MQLPYLHFSAFFFLFFLMLHNNVDHFCGRAGQSGGIFLVTIKYHTDREKSDLKNIFTEVI